MRKGQQGKRKSKAQAGAEQAGIMAPADPILSLDDAESGSIVPNVPLPTGEDENLPASTFIRDVEWVYQQLGGRESLLHLAQEDPDFKMTLLKEGLKLEAKAAEIAAKRGETKRSVVFQVVGLHDQSIVESALEDGSISRDDLDRVLHPDNPHGDETLDTSNWEV